MNKLSFRKFMSKHQWKLILVLFILCFILGYIGFKKYTHSLDGDYSVTDLVYLTLQLATMESGSVSRPVSWELEVARFVTPLLAAYTAVVAAQPSFASSLTCSEFACCADIRSSAAWGKKVGFWHLNSRNPERLLW